MMLSENPQTDDLLEEMPNRLDDDLEPVDSMLEGEPETQEDELLRYTGIGERLTGYESTENIDDIHFGELEEDKLAQTEMQDTRNELGNVNREVTVTFDPEFRDVGQQIPGLGASMEQIDTIVHEYFHAAGYNNDRAELLRDLGFTPYQTKTLQEYSERGEEKEEAVSELLARTINPFRKGVVEDLELDPYGEEVKELLDYLQEEDGVVHPDRIESMREMEEFSEDQNTEYVDFGDNFYIEIGSYEEDGEEKSYAVILGNEEENETDVFKRYLGKNQTDYDTWIEEEIDVDDYLKDNEIDPEEDTSEETDGWYDPLNRYAERDDNEYSLGQGPTAELYAPEIVIGSYEGNQPALEGGEGPVETAAGVNDYAEAGV